LGLLLREAYRGFAKELDDRLSKHGITHAQWVLLWFLHHAISLTPLSLANAAGIKKASATSAIDALHHKGFISAERDQTDRRKVNLTLSPNGKKVMIKLLRCAADANKQMSQSLAPCELALLMDLLAKITRDRGPFVVSTHAIKAET
jgi:DNA-binding MarR family transcriptional regulator